jgi:hypothetical protein
MLDRLCYLFVGDAAVAVLIAHSEGELDKKFYNKEAA